MIIDKKTNLADSNPLLNINIDSMNDRRVIFVDNLSTAEMDYDELSYISSYNASSLFIVDVEPRLNQDGTSYTYMSSNDDEDKLFLLYKGGKRINKIVDVDVSYITTATHLLSLDYDKDTAKVSLSDAITINNIEITSTYSYVCTSEQNQNNQREYGWAPSSYVGDAYVLNSYNNEFQIKYDITFTVNNESVIDFLGLDSGNDYLFNSVGKTALKVTSYTDIEDNNEDISSDFNYIKSTFETKKAFNSQNEYVLSVTDIYKYTKQYDDNLNINLISLYSGVKTNNENKYKYKITTIFPEYLRSENNIHDIYIKRGEQKTLSFEIAPDNAFLTNEELAMITWKVERYKDPVSENIDVTVDLQQYLQLTKDKNNKFVFYVKCLNEVLPTDNINYYEYPICTITAIVNLDGDTDEYHPEIDKSYTWNIYIKPTAVKSISIDKNYINLTNAQPISFDVDYYSEYDRLNISYPSDIRFEFKGFKITGFNEDDEDSIEDYELDYTNTEELSTNYNNDSNTSNINEYYENPDITSSTLILYPFEYDGDYKYINILFKADPVAVNNDSNLSDAIKEENKYDYIIADLLWNSINNSIYYYTLNTIKGYFYSNSNNTLDTSGTNVTAIKAALKGIIDNGIENDEDRADVENFLLVSDDAAIYNETKKRITDVGTTVEDIYTLYNAYLKIERVAHNYFANCIIEYNNKMYVDLSIVRTTSASPEFKTRIEKDNMSELLLNVGENNKIYYDGILTYNNGDNISNMINHSWDNMTYNIQFNYTYKSSNAEPLRIYLSPSDGVGEENLIVDVKYGWRDGRKLATGIRKENTHFIGNKVLLDIIYPNEYAKAIAIPEGVDLTRSAIDKYIEETAKEFSQLETGGMKTLKSSSTTTAATTSSSTTGIVSSGTSDRTPVSGSNAAVNRSVVGNATRSATEATYGASQNDITGYTEEQETDYVATSGGSVNVEDIVDEVRDIVYTDLDGRVAQLINDRLSDSLQALFEEYASTNQGTAQEMSLNGVAITNTNGLTINGGADEDQPWLSDLPALYNNQYNKILSRNKAGDVTANGKKYLRYDLKLEKKPVQYTDWTNFTNHLTDDSISSDENNVIFTQLLRMTIYNGDYQHKLGIFDIYYIYNNIKTIDLSSLESSEEDTENKKMSTYVTIPSQTLDIINEYDTENNTIIIGGDANFKYVYTDKDGVKYNLNNYGYNIHHAWNYKGYKYIIVEYNDNSTTLNENIQRGLQSLNYSWGDLPSDGRLVLIYYLNIPTPTNTSFPIAARYEENSELHTYSWKLYYNYQGLTPQGAEQFKIYTLATYENSSCYTGEYVINDNDQGRILTNADIFLLDDGTNSYGTITSTLAMTRFNGQYFTLYKSESNIIPSTSNNDSNNESNSTNANTGLWDYDENEMPYNAWNDPLFVYGVNERMYLTVTDVTMYSYQDMGHADWIIDSIYVNIDKLRENFGDCHYFDSDFTDSLGFEVEEVIDENDPIIQTDFYIVTSAEGSASVEYTKITKDSADYDYETVLNDLTIKKYKRISEESESYEVLHEYELPLSDTKLRQYINNIEWTEDETIAVTIGKLYYKYTAFCDDAPALNRTFKIKLIYNLDPYKEGYRTYKYNTIDTGLYININLQSYQSNYTPSDTFISYEESTDTWNTMYYWIGYPEYYDMTIQQFINQWKSGESGETSGLDKLAEIKYNIRLCKSKTIEVDGVTYKYMDEYNEEYDQNPDYQGERGHSDTWTIPGWRQIVYYGDYVTNTWGRESGTPNTQWIYKPGPVNYYTMGIAYNETIGRQLYVLIPYYRELGQFKFKTELYGSNVESSPVASFMIVIGGKPIEYILYAVGPANAYRLDSGITI